MPNQLSFDKSDFIAANSELSVLGKSRYSRSRISQSVASHPRLS